LEKINSSILKKSQLTWRYLIVDTLKESGWTADDINFLGIK